MDITHKITVPGFSSRSQISTFSQFPQRDEAVMHDSELHAPGFSNSEPVEDAPQDVHPEIPEPEAVEPGFSNAKAVEGDKPSPAETGSDGESAAKSAAKKTSARKKG